jgi:hypothetical protein
MQYLVRTLNIGAEQTEEFKFASRGNLAYVGDGYVPIATASLF